MTDVVALARALGAPDIAPEYTASADTRTPPETWGTDHWSTLAYLETRIVDHGGRVAHDHMRCDPDRHPIFYTAKRVSLTSSGRKYPTRLRGGVELADHDDYDCLDDMIARGLVEVDMPGVPPDTLLTGYVELQLMTRARYRLTELGQQVAGELRAHKGGGGGFATFVPTAPIPARVIELPV